MKSEVWVPGAQLMESMRAVGYSTRTAVADVIDNAITAKATEIDVMVRSEGPDPYIAILDNGQGMDGDEARHAMRLAGTYSGADRESGDLGRFGLGLKTASLSQCRRLVLVTKVGSVVHALAWDLDHIAATNEWSLLVLDDEDCAALPGFARLMELEHGTLVLWVDLDRFPPATDRASVIDQAMIDVGDHLSLVFHRFLEGEPSIRKVAIKLNGSAIRGADPFLSNTPGVQPSRRETLVVENREILVQAFTLPYLSKLSASDRRKAAVAGSIRDSQGFYVYRGGRLVIWGTWFRLMPKSDLGKLTRVKVDIPNSLDHLWSLDIKKSSAVPPTIVRDRLRALATSMIEPSRRVHEFRGRREGGVDPLTHPWNVIVDRDGFRYEINRTHPAFAILADSFSPGVMRDFELTLKLLETTFPVQDLHNRMSGDAIPEQGSEDRELLREMLRRMWSANPADLESADAFVSRMLIVEPLNALQSERLELVEMLEGTDGGTAN